MGYRKHGCKGSHPGYGKLMFNQETQRPKSWHVLVRETQALGQGQLRSHALWEPPWTHPALGSSVVTLVWHRAMSLVSPCECHLQISHWINHQLNVHSRDFPHTTISKAKDAALFLTMKKTSLSLEVPKFSLVSHKNHTPQKASYFQSLQQINTHKYFCFSSCSRDTYLKLGWDCK